MAFSSFVVGFSRDTSWYDRKFDQQRSSKKVSERWNYFIILEKDSFKLCYGFLYWLGATQNSNECLNSIVWAILSKTKNHGHRSIRGAAALACLYFNKGRSGLIDYFHYIGVDVNEEFINIVIGNSVFNEKLW